MSRLRNALGVVGIGLALAVPASAPAAEVIGQTGTSINCPQGVAYVQTVLSGGAGYSPSAYGVITSWSQMSAATTTNTSRLLVLKPNPSAGANHFIATQKDQVRTLSLANQINTFTAGVRLPIEASERLGLFLPDGQPGGAGPCAFVAAVGDTINWSNPPEPPLNTSVDYPNSDSPNRVNLSAVVEPDADRDVFGDETQDNCVGTAGTIAGCPNTLTLGKAKAKGNKVEVTATVPGAGTLTGGSTTDKTLAATAAKKKKKRARPPLKQSSQTLTSKTRQTVTLTLNLSKAGKSKLARKGKLGLAIRVLYTPTGGTAGSATTTAKLTRKEKRKKG